MTGSEAIGQGGYDAATRYLWAQNAPVMHELAEVIGPVSASLRARVEVEIAEVGDVVSADSGRTTPIYDLPYGEPYLRLPALLFGDVAWNRLPETAPVIPDTGEERQALVDAYGRCLQRDGDVAKRFAPVLSDDVGWNAQSDEVLDEVRRNLDELAARGEPISLEGWRQYTAAAQAQFRNGWYTLDTLTIYRSNNVRRMQNGKVVPRLLESSATGRFSTFMSATSAAFGNTFGETVEQVTQLVLPVGAYGSGLTEKIARTVSYLHNTAAAGLRDIADLAAAGHEDVLARHTARGGVRSDRGREAGEAALAIQQEGSRSVAEVLTLLTAEIVPGYDDPDALVRDIIAGGLVEQFTRAVPMGLLGPFVFLGVYFPGLVQNHEGRLRLNPEVMADIRLAKQMQVMIYLSGWKAFHEAIAAEVDMDDLPEPPPGLGLVCPGALPHGAVSQTTATFGRAYGMIAPGMPEQWRAAYDKEQQMWNGFARLHDQGLGMVVEAMWAGREIRIEE